MKRPSYMIAVGLGLVIGLATAAQAQTNGTWRVSPEPNTRRGVETPPPQPTVVVVPAQPGFPQVAPQPVTYFVLPAILLSDGTILANFGMGYEPVTRSCGSYFVVSNQQRVVAGNGKVLSQGPTYTQPVPNQQTASQQNLPSAQNRYPILTAASQLSCWSMDANGRPYVLRRN